MELIVILVVIIVIIMLPFCHVVASGARNRGRSYSNFFILSLLTSPILASAILLVLGPKEEENEDDYPQVRINYSQRIPGEIRQHDDTKICPFCAETIKKAAILCRYCGSDLSETISKEPVAEKIVQNRTPEDIAQQVKEINRTENKLEELMEKIRVIAGEHREDLAMIDEIDFFCIIRDCRDNKIKGLLQSSYVKIGSFYQIKTMVEDEDLIKMIMYLVNQ